MISYMRFFFSGNTDTFAIRGNHDAGSLYPYNKNGKVKLNEIISDNDFKQILKTNSKTYGEVRDENSLYGFKDYPDKKIRVIFVDSIDNPIVVNSDGSLKYFAQWDYGYQQQQLRWVAEQALGTCPEDYHVVMFGHVPLRIRTDEEDRAHRNFNCLMNIIKTFVNKSSQKIKSTIPDFNVDFPIDYSTRSDSNFVGFFSGHDHVERLIDNNEFQTIVCDNAWAEDSTKIGTVEEDSFCIIEIDTSLRHVKLLGFGRSTDRSFNY